MLAHSGVEAVHGRYMPNYGRGRIRAVVLHNQDHAGYPASHSTDGECKSAEGRDVSGGGERNRQPTPTIYSTRPGPLLVNVKLCDVSKVAAEQSHGIQVTVNENAHEVQESACLVMAEAELGWRRFTK